MEYQMIELVIRSKEGCMNSREDLLLRLRPLIISSIRRYYFYNEELEDLVQEGYLKVLEEIRRFDGNRGVPFLGYIKLQLKYFFMEKGKKQRNELPLFYNKGEAEEWLIDNLPDEGADVAQRLLALERGLALVVLLKGLSKRQRQIMVMHYGRGMNMRSIAKELGVHYQTVVKARDKAIEIMKTKFRVE